MLKKEGSNKNREPVDGTGIEMFWLNCCPSRGDICIRFTSRNAAALSAGRALAKNCTMVFHYIQIYLDLLNTFSQMHALLASVHFWQFSNWVFSFRSMFRLISCHGNCPAGLTEGQLGGSVFLSLMFSPGSSLGIGLLQLDVNHLKNQMFRT